MDDTILNIQNIIINILLNPIYNPYNGSMELKKLQKILKEENQYYIEVIGKGKKNLLRFLENNENIVIFFDNKNKERIRLLNNTKYYIGDKKKDEVDTYCEHFILDIIKEIIKKNQVDEIKISDIEEQYYDTANQYINSIRDKYQFDECISYGTRGDLIRLILKYSKENNKIFEIQKLHNTDALVSL